MRVDPLQIGHDVETNLADLDALGPAGPRPPEVFVGGTQFELSKDFLFAEQLAGRARVLGHEHGRRCPRFAGQPLDLADFLSTGLRKADPRLAASGIKLFSTISPACSRLVVDARISDKRR